MTALWDMIQCSLVERFRRFGEVYYFSYQDVRTYDGGSTHF
jgi:hypothetical protein